MYGGGITSSKLSNTKLHTLIREDNVDKLIKFLGIQNHKNVLIDKTIKTNPLFDINNTNNLLNIAIQYNSLGIASYLLENDIFNIHDLKSNNPLNSARNIKTVQFLLHHDAEISGTFINKCIFNYLFNPYRWLNDFLMVHSTSTNYDSYYTIGLPHFYEFMNLLLANGADINSIDTYGYTPLVSIVNSVDDYEVSSQVFDIIKYLVEHGAKNTSFIVDFNKDGYDMTAISKILDKHNLRDTMFNNTYQLKVDIVTLALINYKYFKTPNFNYRNKKSLYDVYVYLNNAFYDTKIDDTYKNIIRNNKNRTNKNRTNTNRTNTNRTNKNRTNTNRTNKNRTNENRTNKIY
jgi:hypothetical protein